MKSLEATTFREAGPEDGERILRLFKRAFAAVDPGFRARSLAVWRWRYVDNPDAARVMLALDAAGEVVAHYAGSGERVRLAGATLNACQAIDSVVAPELRRLGRAGLFVETGRRFAERFGGPGAGRDRFMWGLPVRPAWRIGRARLGYELLGEWLELSAALEHVHAPVLGNATLEEVTRFPAQLEAVFEADESPEAARALRDARRLNWRYAEHPEQPYRLALLREGGSLAGWAVYRAGTLAGRAGGILVDWRLAGAAQATLGALLAWAVERARADGLERLVTALRPEACALAGETTGDWLALQRAGLRVAPTPYLVVARSFADTPDLELLRATWQVRPGDTDLV